MPQNIKTHKSLLLILCFISILSCDTTEEGCFDLLSANYGFDAVGECEDCCEYPSFKLTFRVARDSISPAINLPFEIAPGDTIEFKNIELLLSEFTVQGAANNYTILDSIELSDQVIKDDYVYFQSAITKTVGQTRLQDTIQGIAVHLGFNETNVNTYQPFDNIESTSQLDSALDSLYNVEEEVFYFSRIEVELNDSLRVLNLENLDTDLQFEINKFVGAGVDWTITISLDLGKLTEGLISDASNEMLVETFKQNFVSALSAE